MVFAAVSCLKDPAAPILLPEAPLVGFDSATMTRTSAVLTGYHPDLDAFTEYGFEFAEGSFTESLPIIIRNPAKDGAGNFSSTARLSPGARYSLRSYITNGLATMYSTEVTFTAPLKSAPSVSIAAIEGGKLVARILDDGGRKINEVGFCISESSDLKNLRRNRIPAADFDNGVFSLFPEFLTAGNTYYVIAYAENSDNSASEVFGYSPSVSELDYSSESRVWFEDVAFEKQVCHEHDIDHNGYLTWAELSVITNLNLNTDSLNSLHELLYMPALKSLSACGSSPRSGKINEIDLSGNSDLSTLRCSNNNIASLPEDVLRNLDTLDCSGNNISSLDLLGCSSLKYLDASNNPLDSLDISRCNALKRLYLTDCYYHLILGTSYDFNWADFIEAETGPDYIITISPHAILPVQGRVFKLLILNNFDANDDGEITAAEAETITELEIPRGVEIPDCLKYLTNLNSLVLNNVSFNTLDISNFPGQLKVVCTDGTNLDSIYLKLDQLADGSQIPPSTRLYYVDAVHFEDPVFERYCLANFDTDANGGISAEEANAVTRIEVCTDSIASIQGIEFFPKLRFLGCWGDKNGKLTSIDLSHNKLHQLCCGGNQLESLDLSDNNTLMMLDCVNNRLKELDLSHNPYLRQVYCDSNQLKSIDLSKCTKLEDLSCEDNQLTSLDVSNNTALTDLYCYSNQLTSLDVSKNTTLTQLSCEYNQLTSLDVSYNTALTDLWCNSNQLTGLDVSKNTALTSLHCSSNQLTSLDVSQNTSLTYLNCTGNTDLTEIWLSSDQIINYFYFDTGIATIKYK